MFRTSARQLARCSRLSLAPLTRPAFRVARSHQTPPAVTAFRAPRFYSTNSPTPENQNSPRSEPPKKPNDAAETNPPEPPKLREPPPGFVHLTEEEYSHLKSFIVVLPTPQQRAELEEVFKECKELGVPEELRDLLRARIAGKLTMRDAMRIPKIAFKMASELAKHHTDLEGPPSFTSNKPDKQEGTSSSPGQEQGQSWPQPQEHQKQRQKEKNKERAQEEEQEDDRAHDSQQKQQQSKTNGGQQPPTPRGFEPSDILTWVISIALLYPFYQMIFPSESSREITWQELRKNFLDRGLVEKLVVSGTLVRVELNRDAVRNMYPDSQAANPNFSYYFSIGSIDAFERRLDEAQNELGVPPTERIPVSYAREGMGANLLLSFGPTLIVIGLIAWLSRRAGNMGGGSNGMFGFGKSKAKMFNHDSAIKVKFSDVAGMDEAKTEIMEFVSFLRTPERFQRLGAKIPRGAILSGPPGTGKTLLAKATAGESQVPFYSVSGSEFVEMFVGVGASRVRDLFATARKNAPCIIFIDEIDAIGKSRSDGSYRGGGNDEREATLNQILTEMDGFNTSEQVVVLAGTNRPDILDQALMRPGRFDRHIHIDRPTMKGRQEIFKVHLKKILTKEDMEYLTGRLAALTPGFAGADIANAVNEAALVGML